MFNILVHYKQLLHGANVMEGIVLSNDILNTFVVIIVKGHPDISRNFTMDFCLPLNIRRITGQNYHFRLQA